MPPSPSAKHLSGTRVAYRLAQAILSLAGAILGGWLARWLFEREILSEPINLVYLSILGLLVGYLISLSLAGRWEKVWQNFIKRTREIPPEAILAAGVGIITALLATVLLNSILEDIPGFTWYWSLLITITLVVTSSWFFVVNRRLFARIVSWRGEELEPNLIEHQLKVIDSSAIIDGRITEIIEANFLEGKLLIPNFILLELQNIADSNDPLRRKRGRRGLEIVNKLVQQNKIPSSVIYDEVADANAVDEKLVRFCQAHQADLITTDFNLNRIAALQGISVLNINQLANAMRAVVLPGEILSLYLVKEGREQGQALAYLEDGTMVVVEDSIKYVGKKVDVVVVSHLQTNVGRMIFAKLNT